MALDRKKDRDHSTSSDEELEQPQDLTSFDKALLGIQNQMQHPSSFIIIVLVFVILLLAFEFGSLQRQINEVLLEN